MTNIKFLVDNDVNIWNEWPYDKFYKTYHPTLVKYSEEWKQQLETFKTDIKIDKHFAKLHGNLGPVYGKQWVNFQGLRNNVLTSVNQIDAVIKTLKENPDSRRIMLNAWNPVEIPDMALDPCHYGFQCISVEMSDKEKLDYLDKMKVIPDKDSAFKFPRKLSLKFNMRSIDTFFGLPFNIASYAYLTHMLAEQTNHIVDELIFSGGDTHIYLNLVDQVKEQLKRTPYELPKLVIKSKPTIYDYVYDDFTIENYKYHPAIKGQIAV
jgi:thymidylate synthase